MLCFATRLCSCRRKLESAMHERSADAGRWCFEKGSATCLAFVWIVRLDRAWKQQGIAGSIRKLLFVACERMLSLILSDCHQQMHFTHRRCTEQWAQDGEQQIKIVNSCCSELLSPQLTVNVGRVSTHRSADYFLETPSSFLRITTQYRAPK